MMDFEWDEDKADINEKKHGVRFEEAVLIFCDPHRLEKYDGACNADEDRWQSIGMAASAVLMVVYTERGITGEIIRIISARKANRHERQTYGENLR